MTERTIVADTPKCPKCMSIIYAMHSSQLACKCADCGCVYKIERIVKYESTEVPMANNEVLIAQAWLSEDDQAYASPFNHDEYVVPGLTVYGLPESELRELLERRGVCEWQRTRRSIRAEVSAMLSMRKRTGH